MKEIKLTKGQFVLVDDADYEWLSKWKWYAVEKCGNFYACRCKWVNGKSKSIYMHRQILGVTDSTILVDHRNRNTLDNQRSNLRSATKSQNQSNAKSRVGSKSKYLGVSLHSRGNFWTATIQKDGKSSHLGIFKKEEDAAIAYNNAAKNVHGQFANLNIL